MVAKRPEDLLFGLPQKQILRFAQDDAQEQT